VEVAMHVIISPKVEQLVTVTMTLTEARDLKDRYLNSYGYATSANSHFAGERAFSSLLTAINKALEKA